MTTFSECVIVIVIVLFSETRDFGEMLVTHDKTGGAQNRRNTQSALACGIFGFECCSVQESESRAIAVKFSTEIRGRMLEA